MKTLAILISLIAASVAGAGNTPDSGRWVVWSEKPAASWEDAFVTGNGRHGTMVMGQPGNERIICVHEELFIRAWDREKVAVADIAKLLPEVRRLVDAGKTDVAAKLADAEAHRQLVAMGAPQTGTPFPPSGVRSANHDRRDNQPCRLPSATRLGNR